MSLKALSLLGVLASATTVYGWGASGHQAVGYVAMEFLAPKASAFVKAQLADDFNSSLGVAATWADEIRSNSAFAWSSNLHFVDAEDNPPTSCSVKESRDCADGRCILTAITNYTSRVVSKSLSDTQVQQALLFLDHFIGDIGQPLHVEAKEVGGNDIDATCGGSSTNLHAVWDSGIINTLLKANYSNSVTTWVKTLVSRINSGSYEDEAPSWVTCTSTTTKSRRSLGDVSEELLEARNLEARASLECVLEWAEDANSINCPTVFDFSSSQDLCKGTYYNTAVPIIETQIAKQGLRLATWLNVLFDGAPNFP